MLLLIPLVFGQIPMQTLDSLAQKRDVAGLTQFLASTTGKNPFNILRTGGGYAAGEMGWKARMLDPKDGTARYVVFSTPILVEDAGELLFRVDTNGKLVFVPERDSMGMRLDSHTFDVSFDLPSHKVMVEDMFKGEWTTAPKPHFVFRMSPTFHVASITDVRNRAIPFSQAGGVVAVSPGRSDRVFKVQYWGTVEKPGFANVIGPKEATLAGSMWYPMIARHPATYDITIHSPSNWLALAQGEEISSEVSGSERVTRYHMKLPAVWISATAGPYKRVTDVIDGIKFSTISADASEEAMHLQNQNNAEVIAFYSKTFGPYPFKTWTTDESTQFRQGVGALEAYSYATYPAGALPFQDTHEPSHTWWGGIINNDYLASIWNESFADYSQVIFQRDMPIGNLQERQRAFAAPSSYTPAFDVAPMAHSGQDIGPAATALGYAKGAYVLQVLEDEIGTPTFLHALHEWVRSNPVAHIGSWEDFEAVVDRVSSHDYTWFFDEWMRHAGMPDFSLRQGRWSNGEFVGKVEFTGETYRIDTDAVLEYPGGIKVYTRITIDPANGGLISIDCAHKPMVVALDPWQIIPRKRMSQASINSIRRFPRDKTYVDPRQLDFMKSLAAGDRLSSLPSDLDGIRLIGSPETMPEMAPLCAKVGFHVHGNRLTYKGTTIDLSTSGAVAVVDLPGEKHCLIGIGAFGGRLNVGKARLALINSKGQLIRAETDPVDTGSLAISL